MRPPGIRRAGFSLDAPACVILCCVLHFLDPATAKGVVSSLARSLAPGPYVIVSIGWGKGEAGHEFASTYNAQDGSRIYAHTWDEISALFDGLDLVEPGLVDCATWRADPPPAARADPVLDDRRRRGPPPVASDDLARALSS